MADILSKPRDIAITMISSTSIIIMFTLSMGCSNPGIREGKLYINDTVSVGTSGLTEAKITNNF